MCVLLSCTRYSIIISETRKTAENKEAAQKVTTYTINEGTASQYYGLKSVSENHVLHYAPNNWKTKRGAINWAKKNGYEVEE